MRLGTVFRSNKVNGGSIRARAPLRLGLAGGGTDLSPYCDEFGGVVLNCTIDRYAYAFFCPREDDKVVLQAHDLEREEIHPAASVLNGEGGLDLHRGVYNRIIREFCDGRPLALTISTTVDAPAGSGLGSSSALVVALVEGFRTLLDFPLGRYDVAHLAFEIERLDLGLAGGKQDHYAAAFGGINFIEFLPDQHVIVNPLRLSEAISNEFEASLVVCFSGVSRSSAEIISQQQSGIRDHDPRTIEALHQLKADAIDMKKALLSGDIPTVAEVLLRSWSAKKRTAAPITTPHIDALFDLALSRGAIAGKVSGAGGGGFLMFLVPPESRLKVINALNQNGGRAGPAHLTTKGSETWISPRLTL